MSSLISKAIKLGFKLAGLKHNGINKDVSYLRRHNLQFTTKQAHKLKFELRTFFDRNSFYKNKNSKVLVIWFHGGGYVLGPFKQQLQRLGEVCDKLGVDGILPDYPKGPEFNYKDNLQFLKKLYSAFISNFDSFYFLGDSAGGGLSLGFSLYLKEHNLKMPSGIYTFSPWLDLSNSIDSSTYEDADPFLSQKKLNRFANYYGGSELDSNFVSPFYGDFSDFGCEIFVYTGTSEILHPTAIEFSKKNTKIKLRVFEDMIHAWAVMPMPEAKKVINEVVSSINQAQH